MIMLGYNGTNPFSTFMPLAFEDTSLKKIFLKMFEGEFFI